MKLVVEEIINSKACKLNNTVRALLSKLNEKEQSRWITRILNLRREESTEEAKEYMYPSKRARPNVA